MKLLILDFRFFANLFTLFGVLEERLVLEVLLAPRANKLEVFQDFFDMPVCFNGSESALALDSFQRALARPPFLTLYTIFAV